MNGARLWLAVAALHVLVFSTSSAYHRRSTFTQTSAKSGWRPLIGSGGLLYSFGAVPLHAPAPGHVPTYKIPVPVLDPYPTSSYPQPSKETTKLTSIAQSYKPTTIRTVPTVHHTNQPINTYHNQFTINNLPYKYVQNIPLDNSYVRSSHNPYARPTHTKYSTKSKQPSNGSQLLTNVQPIHFGQYQGTKTQDVFGKPLNNFGKPIESKKHVSTTMEIFKPEVFKLPDADTASQSINPFVKTAQQQNYIGAQVHVYNPYQQYTYQSAPQPTNLLGSFGSLGIQPVKGRDTVHQSTKTTYLPPQPPKQTIFNSFSYNPNYKSSTGRFVSTTPHYLTPANEINYGLAFNGAKVSSTPRPKVSTAPKIDPNARTKNGFKASPQDTFIKHYQNDLNKITTYNPVQTTTLDNNYYDYSFPSQQNIHSQNGYEQYNLDTNYESKKQKVVDNVSSEIKQQTNKHSVSTEKVKLQSSPAPAGPMYEVVETTEPDAIYTHSSPSDWAFTLPSYDFNGVKSTEPSLTKQNYQTTFSRPTITSLTQISETYDTATQADKTYDNSLRYYNQVESTSKRPEDDDSESIGKQKLKDIYYKIPSSSYVEESTRRTKNRTSEYDLTTVRTTTKAIKQTTNTPIESLPTLAPNQHFKRPSNPDGNKDKVRKRTKVRRRRPVQGNLNRNKDNSTIANARASEAIQAINSPDVHTIRPRVRPTNAYQTYPTTPTVTTDLTTSALPTTSPTTPTIVKKKLVHRRPKTTTERVETTTIYERQDPDKESSIMKISNRVTHPKLTSNQYKYKKGDTPDYTHKQDEKDTPTSDVTVSLADIYKTTGHNSQGFSFHKDVRPIESKYEPVTNQHFKETFQITTDFLTDNNDDGYTTSVRPEPYSTTENTQRHRLRNKYNRPRFSVKDYKSRLSSTTSTTEKTVENTSNVRFPQRRVPNTENYNTETENTTERKKFTPKDPKHKSNESELTEEREKEIHSIRHPARQRPTETDAFEGTTQKISSRIRNGLRRTRPTEEPSVTLSPAPAQTKRPLRKKLTDSAIGESVQDVTVTETPEYGAKNDITSEKSRSESAIMKIVDKKHIDQNEHLFEHSKRVSDLTLAASKDYNNPGMFKTIATNSRRIPNYFTIATDDPILPIEAFFPQLNQKKDS